MVKAIRKTAIPQNTPPTPNNINVSKKKVSSKKDVAGGLQNTPAALSNKSNSNIKEKMDIKCNIITQIKSDISSVDPK